MQLHNIQIKNKTFMIQKQLREPQLLNIKILTQIFYRINSNSIKKQQNNISSSLIQLNLLKPDLQQQFAQITIYTDKHVYENILKIKHINEQLTWNMQTINTIQQTLMGKRQKIDIIFKPICKNYQNSLNHNHNKTDKQNIKSIKQLKQQPKNIQNRSNYILQIICEIKTGINLTLFSLQMSCIPCPNPFTHLKSKLSSINNKISSILFDYKKQQTKLKQQNNTIQSLQKQIKSSSKIQIQYMKNNFVTIINQCKQQIKKYMGNQNINLITNNINNIIKSNNIKNNNNNNNNIKNNHIQNNSLAQIQQNHLQYNQQQQDQQSSKQQRMKKRQIKKINRKVYNQVRPKKMQVQKQQSHHNDHNNYYQSQSNQKKEYQYNQKFIRYNNNDSSSQQQKYNDQKEEISQYRQQQKPQYYNFNNNNGLQSKQSKQSKQNQVNWDQLFD